MTHEWIVRVVLATEIEISDAALDKMSDLADEHDATAALYDRVPGVVITMNVDGGSRDALPSAIDWATSVVCDAGGCEDATPVDVRLVAAEIYEAEAIEPNIPELASAADAAAILRVSRQRIHQLAESNSSFPRPIARVATGPLWTRNAIEWFDSIWQRKPGRPTRLKAADAPTGGNDTLAGGRSGAVREFAVRVREPARREVDAAAQYSQSMSPKAGNRHETKPAERSSRLGIVQ